MPDPTLMFDPDSTDEALAQEVAERVMIPLSLAWVGGVAANARLMQQHADTLRDADVHGR